jgi:hypothetical protein
MRSGFSTAVVLVSLVLVSIVGWAASRAPAPAVPSIAVATTKPAPLSPPACVPDQLSLAYLAGTPAGDSDFGIIAIWDQSARPCTLTGPIVVSGRDSAWHIMTTALSYQVTVGSALTAYGSQPRAGMRLTGGERAAPLIVSAGYKYDALRRYRTCARRTEPAAWQVKFGSGSALTVANADPLVPARNGRGLTANHGLLTCHGVLNAPQPVEVVPRQPSPPG